MWRSFFYALGAFLVTMGCEALIFQQVDINPDAKLPKLAQRIRENNFPTNSQQPNGGTPVPQNPNAFVGNGAYSPQMPILSGNLPRNGSFSGQSGLGGQSRFGPSRFAGNAAGGYGGARIADAQAAQRLAGIQNGQQFPGQLAGYANGAGINPALKPAVQKSSRSIVTKDWMPWSLIAVGSVIFLYTHTSRGSSE